MNSEKKCCFCSSVSSPYCCPRCGRLYCSSKCYRHEDHVQCSEAFYKDWILTSMTDLDETSESKKKMMEILKRAKEEEEDEGLDSDDDDEPISNLDAKLATMNLFDPNVDVDEVWGKLTPKEREEIGAELDKEDLSEFLKPWIPWWLTKHTKRLVQEVDETPEPSTVPLFPTTIPPLSTLTSVLPSPQIRYNLVNVLVAYCFAARLHSGDHVELHQEATELLLTASSNLNGSRNFASATEAVINVKDQLEQKLKISLSNESAIEIMRDVCCLLEGPATDYVKAALSDTIQVFEKSQTHLQSHSSVSHSKVFSKQLVMGIKKLEYLLSWASQIDVELLTQMIPDIQIEIAALIEDTISYDKSQSDTNYTVSNDELQSENKIPTVLIEEIFES